MISERLTNEINGLTTADLIRLHIYVNDRYEYLKSTISNFSSARWAILNPDAAKANNQVQYQCTKAKRAKSRREHAKSSVDGILPKTETPEQTQFASIREAWSMA